MITTLTTGHYLANVSSLVPVYTEKSNDVLVNKDMNLCRTSTSECDLGKLPNV